MKYFLLSLLMLLAWGNLCAQTNAEAEAGVIPLRVEKYLDIYSSPKDGPARHLMIAQPGDSLVASQYFRHKRAHYWKVYYAGKEGYVPNNYNTLTALAVSEPLGKEMQEALESRKKRTLEERDAAAARISLLYEERLKARRLAAIDAKRVADSTAKRKAFMADSTSRETKRIADSTRFAVQVMKARLAVIDDSIKILEGEQKTLAAYLYLKKKFGPYGIMVSEWSWSYGSEYSSAPDFSVTVWNPTGKRMKYIHFSLTATDAVGTRLKSFGKSVITVKGIGPVEPGEYAKWSFENVFWSEVIETLRISSIKVEYMDGTFKTISKPGEAML